MPSTSASFPATPPPEYARLYASLSAGLDAWAAAIPRNAAAGSPIFGAHVLVANANRGEALLRPDTMRIAEGEIDRLAQLGVRGVTVTVSFPLLNADWPHSADYLSFYESVAKRVRDRGLAFTVEQHLIFSGTSFTPIDFDYRTLPFDRFVALDREMSRSIIERLHPDYLTVLSEPDTFVRLTGYRQAFGPSGASAMVERVVGGLVKGTTRVGAGVGAWLPDAADYATAFAKSAALDYVDLHMCPIDATTVRLAQQVVDAARAAGKRVVLDEAWLQKTGPGDPKQRTFDELAEQYRRDTFSFFAPLDARFLTLLADFARANGVLYVAPFWSAYFWAYFDYAPGTKDLSREQLDQMQNRALLEALRLGTSTASGTAYGAAIRK